MKLSSGELIEKLKIGSILFKKHYEDDTCIEYLFSWKENWVEMKGWGTALGTAQDRIFDIFINPNNWNVFPNFNINENDYPYPWSIAYEKEWNESI
jgi:hypothetical protein